MPDRILGAASPRTVAHRGVPYQPQLGRAKSQIRLMRQRFRYLHPQSQFADIQRLRVNKLILAARVAPHDRDLVIARPPVVSAQIVAPLILRGFHNAYFTSTLDRNQVFTIEPLALLLDHFLYYAVRILLIWNSEC